MNRSLERLRGLVYEGLGITALQDSRSGPGLDYAVAHANKMASPAGRGLGSGDTWSGHYIDAMFLSDPRRGIGHGNGAGETCSFDYGAEDDGPWDGRGCGQTWSGTGSGGEPGRPLPRPWVRTSTPVRFRSATAGTWPDGGGASDRKPDWEA